MGTANKQLLKNNILDSIRTVEMNRGESEMEIRVWSRIAKQASQMRSAVWLWRDTLVIT